jgi:hypothetical protein
MKNTITLIGSLLLVTSLLAATPKNVNALRINTPITLDGVLDEAAYSQVQPAADFVQYQPLNGRPSFQPTEAWFFYDENAVYVGALLHDSDPDSIFNYLTERDNIGYSDYFGVYFDPYNQGQLAYGFFVTPAGVQIDIKAIKTGDGDNETSSWDAVWESKTKITDKGWVVEMRIPYAALRFSENAASDWGLNMFRNIRRYNSNNSWSNVDRNVSGFIHQQGTLSGIHDIKPPVRLSVSPYLATYLETKNGTSDFMYKGGLDLKYGINESFTLDMMVIPDFGQVQSDDQELNLSPYELYFSEKRQFFTEGTELFDRADIFYSRRIGAAPKFSASDRLKTGEIVSYNPNETQLINATKVSGRTGSGWGIGVLNALSMQSFATITDTATNTDRQVMIQPLTNYNVAVVDKSLKNNSYISLINTNMSMFGNPFHADVLATDFVLRNKAMNWSLSGKGGFSTRGDTSMTTGYAGYMALSKDKGELQFGFNQSIIDDRYNPNDMGYQQHNNQVLSEGWIYYQMVEPKGKIREYNVNLWCDYGRMYNPNAFSKIEGGYNFNIRFKSNRYFNLNGGLQGDSHDYYETRVAGRYYMSPAHFWQNFNYSSDWRKPLNFSFWIGGNKRFETDQYGIGSSIDVDWKIGHQLVLSYSLSADKQINDRGYFEESSGTDDIVFSKRDVYEINNVLNISYVINNKMSLNARARHYWSCSDNKSYWLLMDNGDLASLSGYTGSSPNYNAFSVDSYFRWVFAPGSEMVLAWKNLAQASQSTVITNYFDNFTESLKYPVYSLSLKVLYYIDYNAIRNIIKKS